MSVRGPPGAVTANGSQVVTPVRVQVSPIGLSRQIPTGVAFITTLG